MSGASTLLVLVVHLSDIEDGLEFRFCLNFNDLLNYLFPGIKILTSLFQLDLDVKLEPFLEEPN